MGRGEGGMEEGSSNPPICIAGHLEACWTTGPQGLRNNRLEGFGQGLLILPDTFLSCFGDRKMVKILMFFFFQLPALLRPPEPLPTLEVLLQGLGLLLGGSLMLTIALLEEQLQPLVSDG